MLIEFHLLSQLPQIYTQVVEAIKIQEKKKYCRNSLASSAVTKKINSNLKLQVFFFTSLNTRKDVEDRSKSNFQQTMLSTLQGNCH